MTTVTILSYLLMTLLGFAGLFLIGLILLQRGRGGGLAGAFGGMGGQSAFGTKAGDVFTRITIGVATTWILLCAGSVLALHYASTGRHKVVKDEPPLKKASAKEADEEAEPLKKAAPKDPASAGQQTKDSGKAPEKDPGADDNPDLPLPANPGEEKSKGEEKPKDEKPAEDVKPKDDPKPDGAGEGDKKPDDPKPDAKPQEPKAE